MKRILTFMTACTLAIAFSSCGGGSSTPEEVAESYVKAVENEDFAKAKKHSTEKAKKMLDMMKSMMEKMDDKKMERGTFKEIKKSEKNGKKATVTYCCNKNGEDQEMKLKKVDGRWKVHVKKELPGTGSKK